jgi:ribosomal protein S18 acetylase RimI-like enzyme
MNKLEVITIRNANMNDWGAANLIHKSAYPDDFYTYANNIRASGTINLVAVIENKVVGYITTLVNPPTPDGKAMWMRMRPYIGYVGVLPDYRGLGIAKELVREGSRRALQYTGEGYIYLEAEEENETAQRLYERLGFEAVPPEILRELFNAAGHPNTRVYRAGRSVFGI